MDRGSDQRLVMVSADSHAAIPPDMWEEYVDAEYRHLLPALREESTDYLRALSVISEYPPELMEVLDDQGVIRAGGRSGASYRDRRIQEMNREGIAAEIVYEHDASVVPLWMSQSNVWQPEDVRTAGRRAYHRWAAEQMIGHDHRLLILGDLGWCADMDYALKEMEFLKESGFFGIHVPGTLGDPAMPALHDPYYEPVWARCEEYDFAVGLHAGFGMLQGSLRPILEELAAEHAPGSGLATLTNSDKSFFVRDTRPRRGLFQILLGGVFDRHPDLKLMVTELRADWIPSSLALLDAMWEQAGAPALRKPSEYWSTNVVAGMSFMKPSEVDMIEEIGLDRLMFGRDYPHAEGTWPKTWQHLKALLTQVPEADVRKLLGGTAISFFGLDEAELASVAEAIGAPTYSELFDGRPVDQQLIDAFGVRSGFHKPAEVADADEIRDLVTADFALR